MGLFFRKILFSPFYFLMYASYPILALFANNIDQVYTTVLFRPLLLSLAFSTIIFILLSVLSSSRHYSALLTTCFVAMFFVYGHIYDYVQNISLFGFVLGRHRVLMLLCAGMFIFFAIFFYQKKPIIQNYANILNTIAIILFVFPIVTITSYRLSVGSIPYSGVDTISRLNISGDQSLPDVYYIILDSYTRSDVFQKVYGYDNSDLLNKLSDMGFYIAKCSTSNYMWTRLSMSSALNMSYLQDNPAYISESDKDVITQELIHHSLVRKKFEALGYKTVAFATGFPFNEITDADIFFQPPTSAKSIRGFEALLVQTTLLRVLQDFGYIKINQTASAEFRDRTLLALSAFDEFATMGGPKFVYVHIITPHPPFVFGSHGEVVYPKDFISTEGQYTDETYFNGYIDQVEFISNEITKAIQTLLAESQTPPIIILQGDHGPWRQSGENRVSILNAYYFPGYDSLYENISPVNSFRIVFNEYFNGNYSLLEDVSYESEYGDEYSLKLLPTSCASK